MCVPGPPYAWERDLSPPRVSEVSVRDPYQRSTELYLRPLPKGPSAQNPDSLRCCSPLPLSLPLPVLCRRVFAHPWYKMCLWDELGLSRLSCAVNPRDLQPYTGPQHLPCESLTYRTSPSRRGLTLESSTSTRCPQLTDRHGLSFRVFSKG